MKKTTLIPISIFTALLSTLAAYGQNALRGGFVDGADVMYYVNVESMNASPFMETVEAMQPAAKKAENEARMQKITEATGITEDDVAAVVVSMDLEGINFNNPDPAVLDNAQAVMAASLKKSVTLEQVKAALDLMAEDSPNPVNTSIVSENGLEVVKIEPTKQQGDGPEKAYATVADGGKVILMSFNTPSLKTAVSRIDTSAMAKPTDEMAAAMKSVGDRHVRGVVVLPAEARQKIKEGVDAASAQGGMAAMVAPFGTAETLIISANTTDSLDLFISLDLGNQTNATQAAGMLQSMVPMMMMQFGQQLGPKAMQISQKIKIAPEENVVTMSLNLTPEDIKPAPEGGQ